jgi:WD40 repeat protein
MILWDLARGTAIRRIAGYDGYVDQSRPIAMHYGFVQDVAFLNDSRAYGAAAGAYGGAISVSDDQRAIVWDLDRGMMKRICEVPDISLYSVAISPDGQHALLGTLGGSALLLDLSAGKVTRRMLGHRGRLFAVAFHPNGRGALSGATDGTLRLWDLHGGAEMRCQRYDESTIAATSVDISSDGRRGLIGFYDGSLILWDAATGEEIRCLYGHSEAIFAGVRFCPDGRTAVSGSGDILAHARDNTVRLWDLETGAELRCFEGHTDHLWDLALSPCGRYVLSAGHDGTVRRWDLHADPQEDAGTILVDISPQAARSVAFFPDGRSALVGLAKGTSSVPDYGLRRLDLETGQEICRWTGQDEVVTAIAISSDGRTALSGAVDGTVCLWDAEQGQLVRHLQAHSNAVLRLLLSPQGDLALSSSQDQSVIVWDVVAGKPIRRFLGHSKGVAGICFARGGKSVFTAGIDRTVREWRVDATHRDLLEWIRTNRHVPELTPEQRAQYRVDLFD